MEGLQEEENELVYSYIYIYIYIARVFVCVLDSEKNSQFFGILLTGFEPQVIEC